MTESTELKGRVKEAAADLTDDRELKNEAKADKAGGKVKQKIDDAVDRVKDAMHREEHD